MKLGGGSMKEMGRSTKSIAIVIFTWRQYEGNGKKH